MIGRMDAAKQSADWEHQLTEYFRLTPYKLNIKNNFPMEDFCNISHSKLYKSRIWSFGNKYFEICETEYSNFIDFDKEIKNELYEYEGIRNNDNDGALWLDMQIKIDPLLDGKFNSGVKAILFSALCIEANINDYAAWQLSDSYFDNHLSNMDVISKWVVLPKLICGKEIDKSGASFASLKKLITYRNQLVHSKSRELDPGQFSEPEFIEKLNKKEKEFDENVHNAYKAILLLSLELDYLIGPDFNPFLSFSNSIISSYSPPSNLEFVHSLCKSIMTKKFK